MNRKKNKLKHTLYLLIALGMLIYALPSISFADGFSWVSMFGAVWAGFALLVIASHMYILIGVDEAKEKQLEAIRKQKMRQWQLKWPDDHQGKEAGGQGMQG